VLVDCFEHVACQILIPSRAGCSAPLDHSQVRFVLSTSIRAGNMPSASESLGQYSTWGVSLPTDVLFLAGWCCAARNHASIRAAPSSYVCAYRYSNLFYLSMTIMHGLLHEVDALTCEHMQSSRTQDDNNVSSCIYAGVQLHTYRWLSRAPHMNCCALRACTAGMARAGTRRSLELCDA